MVAMVENVGVSIEKLLDPERQRREAKESLILITRFFGPGVAKMEAEGLGLTKEEVEASIKAGMEAAKK